MEISNVIECPDCKSKINLEGAEMGDIADCEVCGAEMEITRLNPPRVEVIEEEK